MAIFFSPPSLISSLCGTGGVGVRRAASWTRGPVVRVTTWCEALKPDAGDVPRSRRASWRFVKHLVGM
jgi:hypothetical protein